MFRGGQYKGKIFLLNRGEGMGEGASAHCRSRHLSQHFTGASVGEPYETAWREGRVWQNSLRATLSSFINKKYILALDIFSNCIIFFF